MKLQRRNFYRGPVVAKSLVRDFLNRPLDSFNWIKRLPRKDLLQGLNGFEFEGPSPFLHQLACFNIGIAQPQFLFLLDMGGGKTKLVLDLARWHMRYNDVRRILVVVPRAVHVQSWMDQIEEHAPGLTATALMGDKATREQELQAESDIYLVNYPGLAVYMSEFQKVRDKKKRRLVRKRQITERAARAFAQRFDMVVLDESHRIGNSQSLVYRECRWFTKYCRFRYALTGTPFGRDPTKLWAQFHVIDNGETLGRTLGMFRAAFFDAKENYWGGMDYNFDRQMEKELHRTIQHRSIYYRDTEFNDLPPVHKIVRRVRFSSSAEEQYRNVLKRIKESRGDADELKNAYVRMRMVTSGYLSVKSELDERLVMFFDENPKLEALELMIDDIPLDSKCIIYHDYQVTGKMIRAMLTKNKIVHAELSGLTKDPIRQIKTFLHDPEVRFLVANSESGSEGLNPQQVCRYIIYFESPSSPITRQQGEKRIHRTGQTKRTHIYDIVVHDSIDEKILAYLKEGKDLYEALLSGSGGKKILCGK